MAWYGFVVAAGTLVLGVGLLSSDPGVGIMLLAVSPLMLAGSWVLVRGGVYCDSDGIRYRLIRTTVIPVREIAQLKLEHGRTRDGTPRPVVGVVRTDGTIVKLDPTAASDPQRVTAGIEAMAAALGIDASGTGEPSARGGKHLSASAASAKPKWLRPLVVVFVIGWHAVVFWFAASTIAIGVQYNAMRTAAGNYTVDVQVDHVEEYCYKGCTYTSTGHYTDPAGQLIGDVKIVPPFQAPNRGPISVIASPAHPRKAVPVTYTGAGYIGLGAIFLLGGLAVDASIAAFFLARARRRRRVQSLIAGTASGTERLQIRGILHGPGVPAFVGQTDIDITDVAITSHDSASGTTWHIAMADIITTELDQPITNTGGTPTGIGWSTNAVSTTTGTYYLTCSRDYLPVLKARLSHTREVTHD